MNLGWSKTIDLAKVEEINLERTQIEIYTHYQNNLIAQMNPLVVEH